MTRQDATAVLSILKAAFPAAFRDMTLGDANAMVNLWAEMFADDDPRLVTAAVKSYINDDTQFFPSIGQIKEKMRLICEDGGLSEAAAWALVSRACQNGLYGSEKEFAKLPTEIQALVGSPSQLREWAMMDTETLQSVVASNFQRAYRTEIRRKEEMSKLPADVRKLVGQLSDSFLPQKLTEADLSNGENWRMN